jgi:hypothetical protein
MKIPQDAHIDNVFFCQNPVKIDVNRDKSDVMTSFGMIDWSAVIVRAVGISRAHNTSTYPTDFKYGRYIGYNCTMT